MSNNILYIDEVGRGSLAGPVVTAGVLIVGERLLQNKYFDSKKISPKKRELLYKLAQKEDVCIKIGSSSAKEIDKYGINYALSLSVKRMIMKIDNNIDYIVLDGNYNYIDLTLKARYPVECIINGDSINNNISCASIYAKCYRDNIMNNYNKKYRGYSFDKNKGYGTRLHYIAIDKYGLTDIHRKSFF